MLLTCLVLGPVFAAVGEATRLDLLRPSPESPKVYVQAILPDGEPGLFMVDTGAGVSVIHTALAERLGLKISPPQGYVTGLGGRVPLTRAVLPTMHLGKTQVDSLVVAVGVPGVPTHAGWMPIDGILGNDVWQDFVMVVDYPANVLELHPPGALELPPSAVEMDSQGSFPRVRATLTAANDTQEVVRELWLEVDTGARGVILSGPTGLGFEQVATEGMEPIFGIGASENLPPSAFYRQTRRIPLQSIQIGPEILTKTGPATWINYGSGEIIGPQDLSGLLGYTVLQDHRVIFDHPGKRFALLETAYEPRSINGHEVLLNQDRRTHGRSRDRGLVRARYLLGMGEEEAAMRELDRYIRRNSDDPEAQMLRARLTRAEGSLDTYRALVESLSVDILVEQHEIIAAVNLELLYGSPQNARILADRAVAAQPRSAPAWTALADALLAQSEFQEAREALSQATALQGNPDAELLRRARLALAEQDPLAALSFLRTRIRLYPSEGDTFWFYGMAAAELEDDLALDTYRIDLDQALERLHPDLRPLDFAAAGYAMLGDDQRATELMNLGLARDCDGLEGPSADNCVAWYHAMAGSDLESALARATAAVEAEPHRADFRDTLAVVHLVRGESEFARAAAHLAARLRPDVMYHLWQVDRIDRLAGTEAP